MYKNTADNWSRNSLVFYFRKLGKWSKYAFFLRKQKNSLMVRQQSFFSVKINYIKLKLLIYIILYSLSFIYHTKLLKGKV